MLGPCKTRLRPRRPDRACIAVVVMLQLTGVIRKVPYSYSVRNLVVRWRITLLTGLAFTLVVGLMTVMLGLRQRHVQADRVERHPRQRHRPRRRRDRRAVQQPRLRRHQGAGAAPARRARTTTDKPLASWEVYVVVNQPIAVRKCPVCGELAPVDRFGQKLMPHGDPECPGSGAKVVGTPRPALPPGARHRGPGASRAWSTASTCTRAARGSTRPASSRCPGTKGETAIQAVIGEGLARELGPGPGQEGARGRRLLRPGAAQVDRRRHHEVGRLDVRLGGLVQVPDRRRAVRQADLHHLRRAGRRQADAAADAGEGPERQLQEAGRRRVHRDGVLLAAEHDEPAVPLRDPHRRGHHGRRRRVRHHEHDVRRHQPADQGHRRVAHPRLRPVAGAGVVLLRGGPARPDRRAARLRRRLAVRRLDGVEHRVAAARAAARASCCG